MIQGSVKEYAKTVRERYFPASKKEKGKILDEFTKVTGCYRKAAIFRGHNARLTCRYFDIRPLPIF